MPVFLVQQEDVHVAVKLAVLVSVIEDVNQRAGRVRRDLSFRQHAGFVALPGNVRQLENVVHYAAVHAQRGAAPGAGPPVGGHGKRCAASEAAKQARHEPTVAAAGYAMISVSSGSRLARRGRHEYDGCRVFVPCAESWWSTTRRTFVSSFARC